MATQEQFVGTWKLLEFKSIDSEQNEIYPMGKNPTGYIMYLPNGYMSVSFMMSDRATMDLTPEEVQDLKNIKPGLKLIQKLPKFIKATLRYFKASRNYVSYAGTYEIKDQQVIHHLDVSLIPDWVNTDLIRNFEFVDDKLILSPPVMGGVSSALTWQRVH
ncbi:lipocalin-like domain-containing protein [Roseofilum capinflatum]|uniref:Lipocalin-like domain-containing protein n=1 Tax=Roseofilum capinflatum BLCC-M114 TaxID=3022440 RepID=A0ABT7B8N2_9CYAN|nr:lipocalin-like domain-containing protein [Roseofilum capinflatum]MDJ1175524.1 lipocalin-like domain-containing protein [Roseofilum capinflatum BLCC-M114]